MDTAKLYLVPTPIGNLEDMTFRAVSILKSVQVILAEDTRTSGRLLKHYNIETRMQPYHQFNEHKVVSGLVSRIAEGESMALITDAGTPGISDPGFLLVRACVEQGVEVETLPGATAFVPALVNSGLPCDKFYFEGFLPHKKGRQTRLKILAEMTVSIVLYESPHRLEKTLAQLVEFFGADRQVSVSRELTKLFEETRRGTAEALLTHFTEVPAKGEIVMVIEGKKE
ncbi:MAG: 16S rRNA (cytidine(1402)-2'-O)-methyltransferase [Bacteroidales bacterium]|nr:16S rRNA (cytidine(1402)-2'-O)-methyltransferase [Bacteroidales bacterium]